MVLLYEATYSSTQRSVIREIHLTINLGTPTSSLRSWLFGSQSNVLPGWMSVANCQ